MELEQTLIDLGSQPLAKSKNGKVIRTYLNSMLGNTDGTTAINLSTPADQALERIYRLSDMVKQSTILTKEFGGVRDNNRYPTVLLLAVGVLMVIFIGTVIAEMGSDAPLTQGFVDIANHIVDGLFDYLRNAPPKPTE